jgi:uncharacterized protein Yka (UPF0111/DUF47 family)
MRLVPRDEQFFDLLDRAAELSLAGAQTLFDLLQDCDNHAQHAQRLKTIERAGDEVTRLTFVRLQQHFLAPFEHQDIGELASALDDLLDAVDAVGRRIWLYRLGSCTPLARAFGRVILDQANQVASAVPLLRGTHAWPAVLAATRELNRLEDEADDLLANALEKVFDNVVTVPEMIHAVRWQASYQLLEDATDRAEDVAAKLETITLKYG